MTTADLSAKLDAITEQQNAILEEQEKQLDALRAETEENARHIAALEIRVRDLERPHGAKR